MFGLTILVLINTAGSLPSSGILAAIKLDKGKELLDFVVQVTVPREIDLELLLDQSPWEVLSVPQLGQDLIVAIKLGSGARFFNLGQVTMVKVIDPKDGKEFEVRIPSVDYPVLVSLN